MRREQDVEEPGEGRRLGIKCGTERREAGGQAGRGWTMTFLTFKVSRVTSAISNSVSGQSSACLQPALTLAQKPR